MQTENRQERCRMALFANPLQGAQEQVRLQKAAERGEPVLARSAASPKTANALVHHPPHSNELAFPVGDVQTFHAHPLALARAVDKGAAARIDTGM